MRSKETHRKAVRIQDAAETHTIFSGDFGMQKFSPNIRFAVIYLGAMVAISGLLWALEKFVGISSGRGVSAALPLIAGMVTGQYAARDTGEALSKERMWRDALVFTLIAFVVSLLVAAVLIFGAGLGAEMLALTTTIGPVIWAISFVFVFVISVLLIRFGYGLGIRSELKMLEKRVK